VSIGRIAESSNVVFFFSSFSLETRHGQNLTMKIKKKEAAYKNRWITNLEINEGNAGA
jgi:hypothetical protein